MDRFNGIRYWGPAALPLLVLFILALIPVTFKRTLAGDEPQGPGTPESRRVVRAYFQNPRQVWDLAANREPWEVNYQDGYLVLDVTEADSHWLEGLGFILAPEHRLNELWIRQLSQPEPSGRIPGYPCYRTVEETYQTAEELQRENPVLASWVEIGESWEKVAGLGGYPLKVLRLTNTQNPGPKPALFVMSSLHPREYAPPEVVTRFAEYLIRNYDRDANITWILDNHEIHLLLMANPDGRKQAEAGMFWRKNTNQAYCGPASGLRGADLNRNFDFLWGDPAGSSGDACSEVYRGPSPGSETETQAIQAYLQGIFPDRREPEFSAPAPITTTGMVIDMHSYSELVLWPWGLSTDPAPNGEALQTLGRKLAYFDHYYPEQSIGLYPTSGTSTDFSYGDLGVASYTFEIGTFFFQACDEFEAEVWPRNLDSLLYAATVLEAPYLLPAGPEVTALSPGAPLISLGTTFTVTAVLDDTRYSSANGSEPVQAIAEAEYYLDGMPGPAEMTPAPFFPVDGAFDANVETAAAAVPTTGMPPGRHTLYTRARDADGNWGPYQAIFFYIVEGEIGQTLLPNVYQKTDRSPGP